MKISEFLEGLKNCSADFVERDERKILKLTLEHSIEDNFVILINNGYQKMIRLLIDKGYQAYSQSEKDLGLVSPNEPVVTVNKSRISKGLITGKGFNLTTEDRMHSKKQMKNYNRGMSLHHYKGSSPEVYVPQISRVIVDLSEVLSEKEITFCFPGSFGWNHKGDYSRLVYWPDEGVSNDK